MENQSLWQQLHSFYKNVLSFIWCHNKHGISHFYPVIPVFICTKLDDEIKNELERCQTELRAVSAHNQTQLKRLVKLAREEMARQEIRNK